jgi:hypothetical protein
MFDHVVCAWRAGRLQIALLSIVETLGAKCVRGLSRSMRRLKDVSDRSSFEFTKRVTLLLCQPIFSLCCLCFKLAYFAQERKILLLQRGGFFTRRHELGEQFGDLGLKLGTDLKSGQFLCNLVGVLQRAKHERSSVRCGRIGLTGSPDSVRSELSSTTNRYSGCK